MLIKFSIDYIVLPQHNTRVSTHFTDDPLAAERIASAMLRESLALDASAVKERYGFAA